MTLKSPRNPSAKAGQRRATSSQQKTRGTVPIQKKKALPPKIDLGRYFLYRDEHQWIVVRKTRKGVPSQAGHSYFPRLEQVLEHLLEKELRDSDAASLATLQSEQKRIYTWLKHEVAPGLPRLAGRSS